MGLISTGNLPNLPSICCPSHQQSQKLEGEQEEDSVFHGLFAHLADFQVFPRMLPSAGDLLKVTEANQYLPIDCSALKWFSEFNQSVKVNITDSFNIA